MWTEILSVGAGSCVGGMARYAVSRWVQQAAGAAVFPWGTLTVNVAGCFIIGLIYGWLDQGLSLSPAWRLFLTVGFCGGFTTFSTFANENYLLFQGAHVAILALYVAVSVAAGFAAVYAGYALTRL